MLNRCWFHNCICIGLVAAYLLIELAYADGDRRHMIAVQGSVAELPARAISRLDGPKRMSPFMSFLPDCRTVVTIGPEKKVIFFDTHSGKAIRFLSGHSRGKISIDGKTMASQAEVFSIVRLWDLVLDREIGQLKLTEHCEEYCFSPDGKYVAVGPPENPRLEDAPLRLFEVSTCKEVRRFNLRRSPRAMTFSPDGKTLTTVRQLGTRSGTITLWDVASAKELRSCELSQQSYEPNVVFAPDGMFLAGIHSGVIVWNPATGKKIWSMTPLKWKDPNWKPRFIDDLERPSPPCSIAYSPDARTIVIGLCNGTILFCEAKTARERGRLHGASANLSSITFSPCGLMLGSAFHEGFPMIWDVTGQVLASKKPPSPLVEKQFGACWADLNGADAAKTWQAICALACRPGQAVPLLKKRLPMNVRIDPKRLAKLQDELENGSYITRVQACKDLAELGPPVIPFLNKLYESGASADVRQRIEKLLGEPQKTGLLNEELRCIHAVETLEYIGTAEARQLLEAQSQGPPESLLVRDAKRALDRLAKNPTR